MYKVTIVNDGVETVIHSPFINGHKLETGVIKKEINKIDSFEMSFYLNNPAYGKLKPFKTLINVLNTKTGKYEFEGRVLRLEGRMTEDGLHTFSWICEGELGYLHDSQQKHREWRGTPKDLFISLLNYHNSQVEPHKQFEPGIFEVTNTTDNLYVYTSAEKTTFEEIEDKILNRVGGELRIRKENGVRYLDVLERIGEDKQTEIRIAKNLKSISQNVDPTEIITRLTPLGARIESDDPEATDASQARLTIEEVNNGIPYIDRPDLIAEFGIQGGAVVWDDITLPENLLAAGQGWLNEQKVVLVQYEVSALDLSLIGLDIDFFDVGNSYPVKNPVMNIDERLRIIGKTTDINNPQESSLKIGDKFKTLDEYQHDANRAARRVIELESIISSQSQRIGQLLNQIGNVNNEIDNVKNVIENADLEELPNAINSLEQAIKDLNEALDSIPIYDLATPTQDGLMAATDKAKLDLITITQAINLDDLKAKLDLLSITQQIDLDQLYQDVQDLKNS
ncbi:phage tail protein [Caldibacillus debilis]|uniref:phage tail protein n=1 Tax=Caldibacillus debilis TaxID=301148 RepID=UPI000E384A2C|nr:phage tail protein [Caldibacillus debilis]REJ29290.1 MAG: lysin [Caldibacillus debilis]